MLNKNNKNGFTLLEVILAITVLTIAAGASFYLIFQTITLLSEVQSKLIASYLAQEGIEIVRNIRDNNWLSREEWDTGLGERSEKTYYEADYDDLSLSLCDSPCNYNYLRFLRLDGNFYNYDSGRNTHFKRRITISDKEDLDGDGKPDRLKASVQIFWRERNVIKQFVVQEYLYNWKK